MHARLDPAGIVISLHTSASAGLPLLLHLSHAPLLPVPCAEYTLQLLWDEWTKGVVLTTATRLAPLRILEHKPLCDVWRSGKSMRTHISLRKTVIYAIHRRLTGGPKSLADIAPQKKMSLAEAFAELRAMVGYVATAGDKKLSDLDRQRKEDGVSKLANSILNQQEIMPEDYESQYSLVFPNSTVFDPVESM